MKQKPLLILSGIAVFILGFVVINSVNTKKVTKEEHHNVNNINQASVNNFNDNLRAVTAKLEQIQLENVKLQKRVKDNENKSHETQIENTASILKDKFDKELSSLKDEINHLKNRSKDVDEDTSQAKGSYAINTNEPSHLRKTRYVIDIDKFIEPNNDESRDLTLGLKSKINTSSDEFDKKSKNQIPYYTLPAGSDLNGTALLSALIGEVPVENKLQQPLFPFSAMVGRGSLMAANGISLPPEIKGMKVGGYAIGVGSFLDNISCARAYVTSALFVFNDGHFESIGEEKMQSSAQMVDNNAIGYLTSEFGNPCIKGIYTTNAPQVLAVLTGAEAVGGMGKKLSQWQMSYFSGVNGGSQIPTGSLGQYALGGAIADGVSGGAEWVKNRVKGTFDMVFVPASIPVRYGKKIAFRPNKFTLHLTKTLEINKNINGRKINYEQNENFINDHSIK